MGWVHAQRVTEEENGRAVIALAGVRLARAKAVRWRNIVLSNDGGVEGGCGKEDGAGREEVWRLRASLKPLRAVADWTAGPSPPGLVSAGDWSAGCTGPHTGQECMNSRSGDSIGLRVGCSIRNNRIRETTSNPMVSIYHAAVWYN